MTGSLVRMLGLGTRELVAFTGAGGKSTLMLALGVELAGAGEHVLVTTTTKMGRAQLDGLPAVCRSEDRDAVTAAVAANSLVALATGGDDHKATGPPPGVIDALFRSVPVDYLLVEADGAHGRSLKAPGPHEPVIPAEATTVVVLMGVGAVGGRIADVAHRPEQVVILTGLGVRDTLEVDHCVTVLTHPQGGLKGIPPGARVVVALTETGTPAAEEAATQIVERLGLCERISRVVMVEDG
ncbi:MAG: selenium cofactor biosynthesis protein YqeC [Acidimicrobiia bacterium]|nr:selenium cofactor biosynthesis protein YqeC [Acidimicrobiia bacterium]